VNPRIIKEVRLLLWPWCLIAVAALLPLLHNTFYWSRDFITVSCVIGFFAGIPFLAALSFGDEFHHRTLSLLLGQPVDRRRIWREKQTVLILGVLALLPVFFFCWPDRNDLNSNCLAIVGAWLLATVASTTFWTLVARSTLGGFALGQMALFLVAAAMINLELRIFGPEPSGKFLLLAEALGAAICLGYSGAMFWLGRRKLVRFQATGGIVSDDLLMVGPRMMPRAWAELLRCRPTGSTLNLIRKELRLLRPLWLITLLFLVCWACVVITVRLMPQTEEWKAWRDVLPTLVLALYLPLTVMLAGCMSLGEECSSGTHAWHLTLPVSVRRQWLIKLFMTLGAGVLCAMVVPILAVAAGQILLGSPFGAGFKWDLPGKHDWLPLVLAMFASFPAFWSACAVKGTVRAALWTLPVVCALVYAGAAGFWAAHQLGQIAVPLLTMVISHFQMNPNSLANAVYGALNQKILTLWLILPALLFALIQSYRMFRMPPGDSSLPVIRRLFSLALVVFLCALSLGAFVVCVQSQYDSVLIRETRTAIEKLHIDARKLDAAHPMQLTLDDLAKASPLSAATRQWLRTANFTVGPAGRGKAPSYWAIIHFADGSDYPLSFQVRD
jgi:ABC-type transport system involved in multi-copper enzyme maturation permease subunit